MTGITERYETCTRQYWPAYVMTAAGLIFVTLSLLMPAESGSPRWMAYAAGIVGGLFAVGGIAGLIKNAKWGSELNLGDGTFTWWHDHLGTRSVSLEDVAKVEVSVWSDSCDLHLIYQDGKREKVPTEVVPGIAQTWAENLHQLRPEIELIIK